jgi:pyruvate/2-oxoglutarate/acetoin dehydrogenase E1 component
MSTSTTMHRFAAYKQWSERAQTLREVIDMTCLRDAAAQNVAAVMSAANRCIVVDVDK